MAPSVTPGPKKAGVLYPDGYVGPIARDLKPFATDKPTFSVVVPQDLTVGDWSRNAFTKWLEQRTGVRIEFRQVAGGDDMMTKVNAMIAAGDIPDAFLGVPFTRSQLFLYGQQGLFQDLSTPIDAYAVNLQQMMQEYDRTRKLIVTPDKKIYSFPGMNDCFHCRGAGGRSWVNTAWIKKLGLAMPKTTEELRELLLAFKKADLGGRGRTIPFGSFKDNPVENYFMNSFLYNPGDPWLTVNEGKVEVSYVRDEWREGLKYIRGLYADGLINKDVFTADGDQMNRYGNAPGGPVLGVARGNYWGSFMEIDEEDPNAPWRQYEALPPVEGPNGVRYAAWNYTGVGVEVGKLVITKKCQQPDLLVRWADCQLELDAILRAYSGPAFEWAKAGDKGINKKQAVYGYTQVWDSDASKGTTWNQIGPSYRSGDFRLGERVNPKAPTFEQPLYQQTHDNLFPYKQPEEWQFPPVTLTEDQAAEEAEMRLNLKGEVSQSTAKFVTGQLDPNDDGAWKDYLERLDRIGLKPFLELQQSGYEAFEG